MSTAADYGVHSLCFAVDSAVWKMHGSWQSRAARAQAAQLGGMGLPGYAVDADFHAGMGLPDMDMLQPPHGLPPNAPLYDAAAAAAHVPRRMRGRRRRRY